MIENKDFTLDQIYRFEELLAEKHPDNHHVKDKIRQQLQMLRDNGIIEFTGRGHYRKINWFTEKGDGVLLQVQYNINYPKFTGRNVPIAEIAKAMGRDRLF